MRKTINDFFKLKNSKNKITILTAYDYMTAKIIDQAGIDAILVGDSLGTAVCGFDNTTKVTMTDMVYHTKAVSRGVNNSLLIADMPFLSYNIGIENSVKNAGRLMSEGGCNAVKVEGYNNIESIKAIIGAGIPVMGHLGYTPQSTNMFGRNIVRGKDIKSATEIIKGALKLQEAGVFSIVLECIPYKLAELITEKLSIPTIGIGSGASCDGQVLVINDIIGMSDKKPKHAKTYININEILETSVKNYIDDVHNLNFPALDNTFAMDENIINELKNNEKIKFIDKD